MVMEARPSPDSVGREFVRQYYTLLNQAPSHLHRFYNQQSSFVHGGLDVNSREASPMIGQKQIHQRILQLNFRDCHAKITQVDAQATLSQGIVVQVIGELSNAGQPMRRFTQTFVLAAQSPKKYYVHNDIFRYQDEIIDEDCDTEQHSDTDELSAQQPQPVSEQPHASLNINDIQQQQQQQQMQQVAQQPMPQQQSQQQTQAPQGMSPYFAAPSVPVPGGVQPPQAHVVTQAPPQQLGGVHAPVVNPTAAIVNGVGHPDDMIMRGNMQITNAVPEPTASLAAAAAAPLPIVPQVRTQTTAQPQQMNVTGQLMGAGDENIMTVAQQQPQQVVSTGVQQTAVVEETLSDQGDTMDNYNSDSGANNEQDAVDNVMHQVSDQVSSEPKTYANLFKSGSYSNSMQSNVITGPPQKSASPPPHVQSQQNNQYGGQTNKYESSSMRNSTGSLAQNSMNNRDNYRDSRNNNRMMGGSGGRMTSGGRPDNRGPPTHRNVSEDGFEERRARPQTNNAYADRGDARDRDSNQLFLGNLPHVATEDDLREIFQEYGNVIDLRILSKQLSKTGPPMGGRAPPNYGFITYDSPVAVQNCLAAKPIYFPAHDTTGTPLNVEEKKTKERLASAYAANRVSDMSGRPPRDGPGGMVGPRRGGINTGMSRGGGNNHRDGGMPPRTNSFRSGPSGGGLPGRGGGNGGNTYQNTRR